MLYYYANTGHKIGLDRLRRGAALLNRLEEKGVEARLLVNDFRAGLAAKDLGVKEYVTIETVQDIDAIAEAGVNSIIIDSPEDDHGRLVKYCADFKNVWRFEHDASDRSVHGEVLFRVKCEEENCLNAVMIDEKLYALHETKEKRVLFFLNDADYDKTILGNADFFACFEMELLLGNYFFVKYEDDLAKLFSTLHEPETYTELIQDSETIVTASSQTALEAVNSGARTIYICSEKNALYDTSVLAAYGVTIVNGFDETLLREALNEENAMLNTSIKMIDVNKIIKAL